MNILTDSFKNRKEFIHYNGIDSNPYGISMGIPQDGIGSPVLFNTNKSDIIQCVKNSTIFEFSDDALLIKVIKSNNDRLELHMDLDNIQNWFKKNCLILNPSKTELLYIQAIKDHMTSLYGINKTVIKSVDIHKHLGVNFDQKLNFKLHIKITISKSLKRWGMSKFLCKKQSNCIYHNL